jgi:hypothetical protein
VFVPTTARVGVATVAGDGRRRSNHARPRPEARVLSLVERFPLRSFGIATTSVGAFLIESSGVRGPMATVGLILVALGLAAFDAIDRGLGTRHAGLVAVVVGGGLGSWSLAIVALLLLLELPVDPHLWVVLATGAFGVVTGLLVVRGGIPWVAAGGHRRPSSGTRAVVPRQARGGLRRTAT